MVAVETLPDLDQARRLDVVDGESGYLITDDRYGPLRLSAGAYRLLRAVRSGVGWEELARRAGRPGSPATASDVEAAYGRLVARLAMLRRSGEPPLPAGFWLRRRLIGRDAVRHAAGRLSPLLAPGHALALGVLIALSALDLVTGTSIEGLFDGAVLWPAYALFVASLIVHELGHATACYRFGAPPDDIGFTVYWFFPAFYSDVTAAWRLRRHQRVVVDLGGVYFQLAVGAALWLTYRLTGWQPLAMAFGMILCGCVLALNPFFKLDGYWLLSDALGIPRLSRQPKRLWRHAVARLRGKRSSKLPWPRWVTMILAIYTPASVAFFGYLAARLLPVLWAQALAYPALLVKVGQSLTVAVAGDPLGAGFGDALQRLLTSTFLLLACGWMMRVLVRRVWAGSVTVLSILRGTVHTRGDAEEVLGEEHPTRREQRLTFGPPEHRSQL